MDDMNGRGGYSQPQQGMSTFSTEILDECKDIDRGIDEVQSKFALCERKHKESLASSQPKGGESEALVAEINGDLGNLTIRIRKLRENPRHLETSNKPQVDRVWRRLDRVTQEFTQMQVAHQKEVKSEARRVLKNIYPDAPEEQIDVMAEQGPRAGGYFSQAVCFPSHLFLQR